MGGLIRNSIILLSVSYVQHRIVMITGTVHIGGVDFRGGVGDWSIRAVCVKNIMETGVTNWQRAGDALVQRTDYWKCLVLGCRKMAV